MREHSDLADYYLICCGTSQPHIRAISEALRKELLAQGLRAKGQDGAVSSQWVVMDYGSILIHIMSPEARKFYSLETLWDKSLVVFEGGEPLPPVRPDAKLEPIEPSSDDFDDENFDFDDDDDFDDEEDDDFDEEDEEFDDEDDDFDEEEEDFDDGDDELDFDDEEELPYPMEIIEDEEDKGKDDDMNKPREKPDKGYSLEELFGEKK